MIRRLFGTGHTGHWRAKAGIARFLTLNSFKCKEITKPGTGFRRERGKKRFYGKKAAILRIK